jgi:hypothetical protein
VLDGYNSFVKLVPWVVDLASTYPPPSLLEEWPGDPAIFDPVLRYLLILVALKRLDADRGEQLLTAVLTERWGDAEAVLRESSDLPYPSSVEIYERWLTELNPVSTSDNWDAPLFEARTMAFQARLEGRKVKGIEAIVYGSTPVQVLVQGVGIKGVMQGKQLLHWRDVIGIILARRVDMELFDFFHGNGLFRCPYGRANMCDVQQERCLTGITNVDQLPAAGCKIRDLLQELGYAI